MKCPNCSAEVTGNYCEYCGSEMPKEKENVTITNNYYGDVNEKDEPVETKVYCPCCGSNNIKFNREYTGQNTKGRKKNSKTKTKYQTIAVCSSCGYTFKPLPLLNPNIPQNKANIEATKKMLKTLIWVIGWVFCFPVTLAIYLMKKKGVDNKIFKGVVVIVCLILYFFGLCFWVSETSDDYTPTETYVTEYTTEESTTVKATEQETTANTTTTTKVTTTKPVKKVTIGESNALEKAKSYLSFTCFSKQGLKEQLEYEGFSSSECDYAVKNCSANWNEQCYGKAESYLSFTSFSKQGLREQLEYEGFSTEQINYALNKLGY